MTSKSYLPALRISAAAAQFIGALREREGAEGKLVSLQEESVPFTAAPNTELGQALSHGADDSTIRDVVNRHLERNPQLRQMRLFPEFVDREEVETHDIVEVDGLELCMQADMAEALRGWTLDATREGLVLRQDAKSDS